MSKFSVGANFGAPAKVYLEHKTLGVIRDKAGNPGWLEIKSNKHPDLVRILNREKQAGVVRANNQRRGKVENVTLEEIEGKSTEFLCAALVNWRLVNLANEFIDAPCTDENKREILDDPNWEFLRNCLDLAIVDDEVFMPNSKRYSELSPNESSSLESSIKAESPSAST